VSFSDEHQALTKNLHQSNNTVHRG